MIQFYEKKNVLKMKAQLLFEKNCSLIVLA